MVSKPPRSPHVRVLRGDNGITVVQQDNPVSRAFCVGVWMNTGSRDESRGEEGLCHFLEHMIFKGTANRSAFEISQAIEKIGGSLEAFTTKEQVCVYAQVLEDHQDLAIEILSDMIVNPTFPADQIDLERQVILEEIRDVMDAPDDLIHDLFASEVFPGHPLGRPILGYPETVGRFNRSFLSRFARRHFRGRNLVISIYGTIGRRAQREILDWFRIRDGAVKRNKQSMRLFKPVRRLVKRRLHHQHICIGSRSCSYVDDKRYPLMVLTTLLGGTMSSRLFQRIREELGYTYSIYTYSEAARDTGLIGTYVSVKPANAGKVVREVFREFAKVKSGQIRRDELADTKEHLKGKILLGLETSAAKMIRLARNEIYFGRQISERELIRKIDRVTMDEVMEVADVVLSPDRNTIVSLGPSSAGLNSI